MTASNENSTSFDDLRREIDGLDRSIHERLMRRAEVVKALGELKKQSGGEQTPIALRPGREAEILRRLRVTHEGALKLDALLGLWRSIMSSYLNLQTPFSVLVPCEGQDVSLDRHLFDLARRHFGAAIDIRAVDQTKIAAEAVAADATQLAVMPTRGDWWTELSLEGTDRPRIVASLPHDGPAEGYLLSRAALEPTGDDFTLILARGLESSSEILLETGHAAGLDDLVLSAYKAGTDAQAYHLLRTTAEVSADALLALSQAVQGNAGIVGLMARPLDL